jgi:hypothetical protein
MCSRPNYEELDEELDELLTKLYDTWSNHLELLSGDEVDINDKETINLFSDAIRDRLTTLFAQEEKGGEN